jgi:hypothetical protein
MEELSHILLDPAHWIAEFMMDFTIAIPFYFIGKWRVRVHDRNVHGKEHK